MKAHPIAGLFPLLEGADFDALVKSMRENGFDPRHPVVAHEGLILDGRNRYRAAKKAGIKPIIKRFRGDDPLAYAVLANVTRRHLDESQRAMVAARLATLKHGGDRSKTSNEALTIPAAGSRLNVGKASVERARVVLSEGTPELVRAVDQGKIAVSAASKLAALPEKKQRRAVRRVESGEVKAAAIVNTVKLDAKRALAEKIRGNPLVTPDGRYQVLAIDPPWKYNNRAEDASHRGKNLYPDMTVKEIRALPVAKLAQKNCVLWLWTTNAFMRHAYACLDAWGFEEKTILTWDKMNIGLGDWLRNVTEHCILAVRGKPVVSLTNQTTLISEKRREHSRKPEAFYKLVEKLCPGSKLEMFAREKRKGWVAWGAETEKFEEAAE